MPVNFTDPTGRSSIGWDLFSTGLVYGGSTLAGEVGNAYADAVVAGATAEEIGTVGLVALGATAGVGLAVAAVGFVTCALFC